ncbi:uncharacterized protein FOMMEDRAFT_156266 [Fomitiporia mediterranea MF3/22]|uniref:uncharacterized protein n=1 Tax=Fomitiporia mediterranea (strain MF3/22) TaxID=694068 RepID=UPI0004409A0F|nr:uncharacterized protein FOMMEDRAFT_156266 [Fomitiporia mediterranea MF3/22]EJD02903.1 hypothetical protein FOMMEDRAFT_156266 [Fomitiporia mediterranea MF3/22]
MPFPNINTHTTFVGGSRISVPPVLGTLIDDGSDASALELASVLGYGGYGIIYCTFTKRLICVKLFMDNTSTEMHFHDMTHHGPSSAPNRISLRRHGRSYGISCVLVIFCFLSGESNLIAVVFGADRYTISNKRW